MKRVVILGAGITGLSLAFFLERTLNNDIEVIIIEKDSRLGGMLKSDNLNGYTFDMGGHVLHSLNKIPTIFVENVINRIDAIKHTRQAYIYIDNFFVPYPFQYFFYMHPNKKLVKECINGLKKILYNSDYFNNNIDNLESYIEKKLGYGISKYFMKPYNLKLWKYNLKNLDLNEMKQFIPDLPKEIIEKIIETYEKNTSNIFSDKIGYNPSFIYPKKGGIESLIQVISNFISKSSIILKSTPTALNLKEKILVINDSEKISYDILISTIPLIEFLHICDKMSKLPYSLREISKKIISVKLLVLGLGLNSISHEKYFKTHWTYFPETNISFHRVINLTALSPFTSPKGKYCCLVEVSLGNSLVKYNVSINKIISDLIKIKLIDNKKDIDLIKKIYINYAYPIPVKGIRKLRKVLKDFFKQYSIFLCGRLGEWKYNSIADSIRDAYYLVSKLTSYIAS